MIATFGPLGEYLLFDGNIGLPREAIGMLDTLEKILQMPVAKKIGLAAGLAVGGGVFWLLLEVLVQSGYYSSKIAFMSVWMLASATFVACLAIFQARRENDGVGVVHGSLLGVASVAIAIVMTTRAFAFYAMTKVVG